MIIQLFLNSCQDSFFLSKIKTPFNINSYFFSIKMAGEYLSMRTFNISHFHDQGLIIFPVKNAGYFIG